LLGDSLMSMVRCIESIKTAMHAVSSLWVDIEKRKIR